MRQWFMNKLQSSIREEGDCHIWQLSKDHRTPVLRNPFSGAHSVNMRVPQFILEHIKGRPKPKADKLGTWGPYAKCGCSDCVNPEHLVWRRRSAIMEEAAVRTGYHLNPARNAKISASRPRKLTPEAVDAIRTDTRPMRIVAKELGVCFSAVQQCRAGDTHKDYRSPWAALMR